MAQAAESQPSPQTGSGQLVEPAEVSARAEGLPLDVQEPPLAFASTDRLLKSARKKRRKGWIRRTLELAKLQADLDDKLKWLDETYRQLGERLVDEGLPEPVELEVWLGLVRRTRKEADLIQQRMVELETPQAAEPTEEATRPRLISGGAASVQTEALSGQASAGRAAETAHPTACPTNAASSAQLEKAEASAPLARPDPSGDEPAAPFEWLNPIEPIQQYCGYCGQAWAPDSGETACPHCGQVPLPLDEGSEAAEELMPRIQGEARRGEANEAAAGAEGPAEAKSPEEPERGEGSETDSVRDSSYEPESGVEEGAQAK